MDIEQAVRLSNRYGISLNFMVKESYLMHLLVNLAKLNHPNLILTGGTAINKIYLGKMGRFSEDADFELKTRLDQNEIDAIVKKINDQWFERTEKRRFRHLEQIDFVYTTTNKFNDKVRLDINLAPRFCAGTRTDKKDIVSVFTGEIVYGLSSYTLEELVARKIYAMSNRSEGKDIYDVYHSMDYLKTSPLRKALDRLSEQENTLDGKVLDTAVENLRSIDVHLISSQANPYIPSASRPNNWKVMSNSVADYLDNLST